MSFIPTANNEASRVRIEPGIYRATCIAVHDPAIYYEFQRWYLRVDFAIHDEGTVSKYVNLDGGKTPRLDTKPRSDYYKLWTLAAGRKPAHGEPMDPAIIKGLECRVAVVDKRLKETGETYSAVSEALSLNCSTARLLNNSITHTLSVLNDSDSQPLNHSGTQVSVADATARPTLSLLDLEDEDNCKSKSADKGGTPQGRPKNGRISPEAVDLARELTRYSEGQVCFLDKHKIRLSETLKEFTAEEITTVFENWSDTQTAEELEKYGAGLFVQIVDAKCDTLRRERREEEEYEKEMAAYAARQQTEAEQEHRAADVLCASV